MKLYILINSSETSPGLFGSQLDKNGLEIADNIVSKLDSLIIDDIYSSPFLSTLQTIYPYCKKNNRTVNVECGFYNKIHVSNGPLDRISIHNYQKHAFGYSYVLDIVNRNYKTRVFPNNISQHDGNQDIINRLFPLLHKICKSGKNVLIVTHKSVLNYILYFFDKNTDLEKPINDKIIEIVLPNQLVKPEAN
jgi:broad specificity phosphatase PhoE